MFFGKRFSGHEGGIFSGLDILVLSIIENYDGISGYDLARSINKKFNKLWHASPGTIYPLLNRLAKGGFIEMEVLLKSNRNIKLYRITESGQKKLREVLKSNLEPSIDTLGEYLRTIVQTWIPNEDRIHSMMSCFPYNREHSHRSIDTEDYSIRNIERVKRILGELNFSKSRIIKRMDHIDKRTSHLEVLLSDLQNKREKNTKTIEIVDDDDYNDFKNS
ncbi:MAG: PadR family transcriptional regulator [Candidatus Lokiarchaeota archaeon]|nr:PadR family transcriptional regulator [Candidatus Lokiarchaeota archaeon]